MLLVGFSEIGEDVDSLAFGGFLIVKNKDLINYGLMTNLMRENTNQYCDCDCGNVIKKLGGLGDIF